MEVPVLLTGTIAPSRSIPSLTLTDPETRWEQYARSIAHWLQNTPTQNLVFCENSGATKDFDSLLDLAANLEKHLEILQFQGDQGKCISLGKGYGEGEIIDFALSNSRILSQHRTFYKVTGRLTVSNFNRGHVWWNRRDTGFITMGIRSHLVDTRFFRTSQALYNECLRDAHAYVRDRDNIYLEHVFYDCLRRCQTSALLPLPKIEGVSGTSGDSYFVPGWKHGAKNIMGFLGFYRL